MVALPDERLIEEDAIDRLIASGDVNSLLESVDSLTREGKSARALALLEAMADRLAYDGRTSDRLMNVLLAQQDFGNACHYGRAAVLQPDAGWGAFSTLFEALHGVGDTGAAVETLRDGIRRLGPDHGVLKRAAHILMTMQDFAEAKLVLKDVLAHYPDDTDALYNYSYAHHMLGDNDEALSLALTCRERDPRNTAYANYYVHLLSTLRRFQDAIRLLRDLIAEHASAASYRRTLSGMLTLTGNLREALSEGLAAIRLDERNAEYWVHVGGLSKQLGFKSQAIEFMRRAAELNPTDPLTFYALAHHLREDAQLNEARTAIGSALALAPGDSRYRDFRITLAERQRSEIDTTPLGSAELIEPLPRSRDRMDGFPGGGSRSIGHQMAIHGRVIWGLTMRFLRLRDSRSQFGIATVLIEPLIHIVTLWAVMSVMMHGRPPLGDHWFFFYATGIIPFLLVTHLGAHGVGGHQAHKHLLDIPILRTFDIFWAEALTELIISTATAVIIFILLYAIGAFRGINNFDAILSSLFLLWIFGIGLMIINHVMSSLFPIWKKTWEALQRVLYFTSGIFYMAQAMPVFVRDILVWNPLLVGIEWFRNGFFNQYNPPWLDRGYLIMVSGGTFIFGVMLERALRRKLH
ncbi:tetratricopeptide repeat protein [Labrys sp. KB_33_2]|uniref:tetratricopeptide repeat protein n=1 Tax=Labrys sp. KB_33_2 TaxID=3237479 RepID=UPI003F9350F5